MRQIKAFFLALFCLFIVKSFAQDQTNYDLGRHEIKLNLFNAVLESLSLEYECVINTDFTAGIGANYFFDISSSEFQFIAYPNIRFYPGRQEPATGFFTELSVPFYANEGQVYNNVKMRFENDLVIGAGIGVAAGYKLMSKNGFTTELFLGACRNFNNDVNVELFSRFGVTFGKRF